MKAMTIQVPPEGAAVELVLRGGESPAQAVIVAADGVEVRCKTPGSEQPPAKNKTTPTEKPAADLDEIFASLVRLRTKKRTVAINVIRTMFQFTDPITIEKANRILDDLRRRGYLSITPAGGIEFSDQKESASTY